MQTDIFIPARLGSKRLASKQLKEINNVPIIKHLVNRLKDCKSITNIVVCTTNSEQDEKLVEYLEKENILIFRGSEHDILDRFLKAAYAFNTEIIIDVEADKIYTDPKYVDLITHEMQNLHIDFMTGNNSLDKFDPEFGFHGFVPAGIKVKALERICELKKTDNTETGYKEFFTTNDFIKRKFLLPEKNIKIPKKFRFSLDYPEDLELAKIIFSKLGTNFDTTKLLKFIEENPNLQKIIDPIIEKWKKDYDQNITKFDLNKLD
jgi:spore coat polysaccharide biosynthesis protein SpsF